MHFRMVETKYRSVQAAILAGGRWFGKLAMGREDTSVGFKTRAFLIAFFEHK
jgi:hypothetical protein